MNVNQPFENLKGKVCVVTGGAGGIGTALCDSLSAAGINIAVLGRNADKAKKLATDLTQQHGNKAMGIACDVLDKKDLARAKEEINRSLGPVSFLINCAGGNHPNATAMAEQIKDLEKDFKNSFLNFSEEGMDFVFDLNFKGSVLPSMVFSEDMIKAGHGGIINISSVSGDLPLTRVGMYSAAKEAINSFTKWLAVHFAHTGVRVNAIAPGFFITEQNRFLLFDEKGGYTPRGEKIIKNTPVNKFGEVGELGGTALYLFSDLASFVTGAIIPVDGGFTAYGRV